MAQDARSAVQPIFDWVEKNVYDPVAAVGKAINKVPSSDDLKRTYRTKSDEVKSYVRSKTSARKPKPYKTAQ